MPVSPFHLLCIGRDAELKYPIGSNCNWTHGIHKETYSLLREFAEVLCDKVQLSHCILLGQMRFLNSLNLRYDANRTVEISGMAKHMRGNDRNSKHGVSFALDPLPCWWMDLFFSFMASILQILKSHSWYQIFKAIVLPPFRSLKMENAFQTGLLSV